MIDYINFKILSHFFDKISEKFSKNGHTHKKSDIIDIEDSIIKVTDDNDGNVTIEI